MDLDILTRLIDDRLAKLEELDAAKPSYTIEGHSVRWEELRRELREELDWLSARKRDLQPFEIHSDGTT